MIISRTPFRISFFGGGTDYPTWYREHGGKVLSATIDKYCYLSVRKLPPFFEHKHRVVYSAIENINEFSEIKHPAVREVLKYMNVHEGLEIHHDADLPARSGMGSSSSFTVGLLNALYALHGRDSSRKNLASTAIHIEQDLIKETVGSQDQIAAAFGGINRVDFRTSGEFDVTPMVFQPARKKLLEDHLMLFFTGISRIASTVAEKQVVALKDKEKELTTMASLVDDAVAILRDESRNLDDFGKMLHETWLMKRSISSAISSETIDDVYSAGCKAGALGGKLLGAGGGGFILFFVEPEKQPAVRAALKDFLHVDFGFSSEGSKIVLYEPEYDQ